MMFTIDPHNVERSTEMRRNPRNIVVQVGVDSEHGEALMVRIEPVFKLS
jgi:hypothetical protein